MKALAAEMVRNFGQRLTPLGINVRELTGDVQLTKYEIQHTQVNISIYPYIYVCICCSSDDSDNSREMGCSN